MRKVKADLHVHTCLSPCGDPLMVATAIVRQAKEVGMDMIGICDHNSAENVAALVRAGAREGLAVIPGMEICSSEEVHILGLFGSEADALRMQELVYKNLPGENLEDAFGPQTVVDQWDQVVGSNARLLIGATTLSLEEVVDAIHHEQGLAIASHVDRERFSLVGQLGFIPKGLALDAVEVSRAASARQNYDYPVIISSDAHFLEDVGSNCTCFEIEEESVDEIRKALRQQMGRAVCVN
jgi:predicted metal-dependent phosphoesterase TrpH